ncbi:hypothetical protein YC2023_077070 [Brassica napus]
MHITDLTVPSLQRIRRIPAVVEYVLSGHLFKLHIQKLTCTVAFAISGIRFLTMENLFQMKLYIYVISRKIMQRDVEEDIINRGSETDVITCVQIAELLET